MAVVAEAGEATLVEDYNELYAKHAPEVERALKKFADGCFFPSYDKEDIIQELRIASFDTLKKWDENEEDGASFLTYAYGNWCFWLEKKMRWFDTQKRGGLEAGRCRSEVFIADLVQGGQAEGHEIQDGAVAHQGYIKDTAPAHDYLPAQLMGLDSITKLQKKVLLLLIDDYNLTEIRKELDITPGELDRAMKALAANTDVEQLVCG